MFFSAVQLHEFINSEEGKWNRRDLGYDYCGTVPLSKVQRYVKAAKEGILRRDGYINFEGNSTSLYKWFRPWEVVPKLRDFSPPVGDYGIGVEVEMGFTSRDASRSIARKIGGWKNIALDLEGGDHPIEATFPPVLLSKLSNRSQVFRYLKLLRDNDELVVRHSPSAMVGTHINVSKGGVEEIDFDRGYQVDYIIEDLDHDLKEKYFGRNPYGGCESQGSYIEYKLFDSTTDSKALRKYINVAVALTDLICDNTQINEHSVIAALETGYNK